MLQPIRVSFVLQSQLYMTRSWGSRIPSAYCSFHLHSPSASAVFTRPLSLSFRSSLLPSTTRFSPALPYRTFCSAVQEVRAPQGEAPPPPRPPSLSSIVVQGVVVICVLTFAIHYFVQEETKATGPYRTALRIIQMSPEAQEALGTPIIAGYTAKGKRYEGHKLLVEFGVSGPRGSAHVVCKSAFVNKVGTIFDLRLENQKEDINIVLVDSPPPTMSNLEKEN